MRRKLLVIGATGMLGRPVMRALASASDLDVRAFVRDPVRAHGLLPSNVELVRGDLRDRDALDAACRDVDTIYTSLNTPWSPSTAFDPDRDGTGLAVQAAVRMGVRCFIRLSALEVGVEGIDWWVLDRKRACDVLVLESALEATVLRPTWFMESIALFARGPMIFSPVVPSWPLWWSSGADLGKQIVRLVLERPTDLSIYPIQGSEPATLHDAVRRFALARPENLRVVRIPQMAVRLAGLVSAQARYGAALLRASFSTDTGFTAARTWGLLGRPETRIEDYAHSIDATGDMPRK